MSSPLNECCELLPDVVDSEPKPTEENVTSEIIEKVEIDTITKTSSSVIIDPNVPSSSSSSVVTQELTTTTLTQNVTNAVTEDSSCDNLPSDEDDEEDDEFDEFRDKRKRKGLAERLPVNSYYKLAPRVFIFPGAEVYMDDEDDDDSASCVDEQEETVIAAEEVAEIKSNDEAQGMMDTPLPPPQESVGKI